MNIFEMLTLKKATYYLSDKTTVRQALEKFDAHKFSVVPILTEDVEYITSVSEGDILRFIKNEAHFDLSVLERTMILDIERYRPYEPIRIDATFDEIYSLSLSQNFVPVVDDRDKFIGLIKRRDIFIYLKESKK